MYLNRSVLHIPITEYGVVVAECALRELQGYTAALTRTPVSRHIRYSGIISISVAFSCRVC